jgi:hypothetical protein
MRFFSPRDILQLDGGRSRISVNAFHGPAIDVFKIGGGRSRTFDNASERATMSKIFFSEFFFSSLRY